MEKDEESHFKITQRALTVTHFLTHQTLKIIFITTITSYGFPGSKTFL